jgi:hypothetical protein
MPARVRILLLDRRRECTEERVEAVLDPLTLFATSESRGRQRRQIREERQIVFVEQVAVSGTVLA